MLLKRKLGKLLAVGTVASMLATGAISAAPLQEVSHTSWMQQSKVIVGNEFGDLELNREVTLAEALMVVGKLNGIEGLNADAAGTHWASGALALGVKLGAITQAEAAQPDATPSAKQLNAIAAKAGVKLGLAEDKPVTRKDLFEALGNALTTHITIGHTNDVHGHIVENEASKEFGYAKMATLIKEWRAENPNFLLLDAGDTFQGTVYVNQSQGESILPILNKLAYNAMAAGNHEFDFGYEQLVKLAGELDYPVINANAFKADGTNLLEPYYFAEIGGKKFAFLGLVTEETPVVTHPNNVKGLTFKNPVEVAKQLVPELRKKADHVIVVSHVGIDIDREIAKNVPGIDLIVGGHTHTELKEPENVNGTYIVQDWEYGKSLGRADLYYFKDKLVAFSGGLKAYDETVVADEEIGKLVDVIAKDIDEKMSAVIAKAEVDLDGDRKDVRARETNFGNLTADTMLARTKTMPGFEADVALTNGGGIRDKVAAGEITKKMLQTVFPFPNTLTIVEVTGSDLKAALENGVSQVETGGGRFPQIAGMSFSYDPAKPVGERVVEVKVGGQPLDASKKYRVATNDFLASGGDGYESFAKSKALNSGITFYDMMEEMLINSKSVNPKTEGRITVVK